MENEIIKLQTAKMFMDCLSNGIDPVTNTNADVNTLSSEEVISCFRYISNILDEHIYNIEVNMKKNNEFFITDEQIAGLNISQNNRKVSEIANEINRAAKENRTKKLSAATICNWLEAEGYLCQSDLNSRIPTEKGNQIGITTERRKAKDGTEYYLNLYSPQAQRFVFEHLKEIIALEKERHTQIEETTENIDFPRNLSIKEFIQQHPDKCFVLSVGSCDTAAKFGSYTAVLLFKGKSKILKKSNITTSSSNKCILTGVLDAVSAIKLPTDVVVLTSTPLGFNTPNSRNYNIYQNILRILEEKKCTVALAVCQGKGLELNNFIESLE